MSLSPSEIVQRVVGQGRQRRNGRRVERRSDRIARPRHRGRSSPWPPGEQAARRRLLLPPHRSHRWSRRPRPSSTPRPRTFARSWSARAESTRLREQLKAAQQETAVAQEQREALRWDMKRVLDDVLASKASGQRGAEPRPRHLAHRRGAGPDAERVGASRVGGRGRATAFRRRTADPGRPDPRQGNYGGASYLADRAFDLVQQARTVARVAAARGSEERRSASSRSSPAHARGHGRQPTCGTVPTRPASAWPGAKPGAQLVAVARIGDWFQVGDPGRAARVDPPRDGALIAHFDAGSRTPATSNWSRPSPLAS